MQEPFDFESECPHCHQVLAHHRGLAQGMPRNGDCSFCFHCGGLSVFEWICPSELIARLPTPEEQKNFDADPRLTLMTEKWLEVRDGA